MSRRAQVDLDTVAAQCESLELTYVAECLPELVEEAAREDLSPVRFLERVLEREIESKTERRVATSLKLSGLPPGKTLASFDWTFQPRADRGKVEALATCAFIRAKQRPVPGTARRRQESSGNRPGSEGHQERLQRHAFRPGRSHARAQE